MNYRPVRVGWVIADRDLGKLATVATWNACLWGGNHNCIIPALDQTLADNLVSCFGVDILMPVSSDEPSKAYIERFPHLHHHRWTKDVFHQRDCEFADIRHAWRRILSNQDTNIQKRLAVPKWEADDPLGAFFALQFGVYPEASKDIPDYRAGLNDSLAFQEVSMPANEAVPILLRDKVGPIALTGYGLTRRRNFRGWLGPGIVLGSVTDFDALAMFWNLRAAGASLLFYDQAYSARLKLFTEAFISGLRGSGLGGPRQLHVWTRSDRKPDDSWKPDLELEGLPISLNDGRGDALWNGMNVSPNHPTISAWHRDVVPSYVENDGKPRAYFTLPDRPFSDDDVSALRQKFAVVVDASQFGGPDADMTFETPYVPRLNEFYGRNFHFQYDAARVEEGSLDDGAIAIITSISTQNLHINAFRVFDWLKAFFGLCKIDIERSEAGLRCSRLITQLGGLDDCRVLKIRGVRALLRKYEVEQSFTRSGAIEAVRDEDKATGAVGFDAFKRLFIEARELSTELKPDDALRFLLTRRVFRVGLEFTCPNCELPSWIHLDDVRTLSSCGYCDHQYDVSPQLKDRDWRYRRSGIFGRGDNQLGGVPVALTLQQLSTALHDQVMMYSTALNFTPAGSAIEPCESDFVAVIRGGRGDSEAAVQILFGEAKTERAIDAEDIRKLGKLADSIPEEFAESFIMFSKTGEFSAAEIALAKTLNGQHRYRVILWSREELEPFYPYERSKDRLGDNWHASSLADMARVTHMLYLTDEAQS